MWQETFISIWIWKKETGVQEETDRPCHKSYFEYSEQISKGEREVKGVPDPWRGNRQVNAPKDLHLES